MQSTNLIHVSLKTKMALAVGVLFAIFILTAAYLTLSYFEHKFKDTISIQQFSLVSSLATTIDDKLNIAQNALIAVASSTPPDVWHDGDKAQRFLDGRIGLKSLFDNGIFLMDSKGTLISETPFKPDRRGKDLSFREFVQKTIATRKPYISQPFISGHRPGQPVVAMCVPIFDRRGELTGILVGGLSLLGANSLAELSRIKIGKGGYLYISDSNRILIVHPDKDRIMKPGALPGVNKIYDQAISGFEGSGETVTSYGVAMLSSCKRLRMTSWILVANYPAAEAYAPLDRAKGYFVVTTVIGIVLLLFSTWLIMKRLMSPLAALTRHVKLLPEKRGGERLAQRTSMDEIGVLVTAFNAMVTTMDQQQESIREREEQFRLLADFTSDWEYWIDPRLRIVYSSPSCREITGYPAEEIMGNPRFFHEIVHAEDRERFLEHLETSHEAEGERSHDTNELEFRIVTKQGEVRWLNHVCRPMFDHNGIYRGRRASNRDITDRKRAEEQLHAQALMLELEVAERQKAQEILALKQQQLEALNSSLETRISLAVTEMRQKDQILIQQNRLAAMGEMINNIAHQWRQPLNNVGLIIQNLMYSCEQGDLTEAQMRNEISLAMDTIQFMSRTIDDFRSFTRNDRSENGFQVTSVVDRTLEIISAGLKHDGIAVETEAKGSVSAIGFANEYSQVLLNILANAKDVLLERDVADPRIRISTFAENGRSVVTIRDNGGGIDDAVLPKIFDPYFSTKHPGRGTGVGLYMSKMIIEKNMRGTLSARTIDGGAEFRIEVPSS